jgi:hypothetical protein
MTSGTAASVKLYATGLRRPRVVAVEIELMSACGVRRDKAALSAGCKPHPARPLQPEATGAAMEVAKWLKPSDSVSRYAVTARVCGQ